MSRRLGFILSVSIALAWSSDAAPGTGPEGSTAPRPIVKVTSPKDGVAFVMQPGSDTKLLVTVEITDAGGSGLETDDTGTPKFYEPDDNVDRFASNIIAKGTYMNHLGQTVTQFIAEIPARDLKISKDKKMSPPFDVAALTEEQRKNGFSIPPDAVVDMAEFGFRVRDRNGEFSVADAESTHAIIGIAWQLYAPHRDNSLSEEHSKKAIEAESERRRKEAEKSKDPLAPKPQQPTSQEPTGDGNSGADRPAGGVR